MEIVSGHLKFTADDIEEALCQVLNQQGIILPHRLTLQSYEPKNKIFSFQTMHEEEPIREALGTWNTAFNQGKIHQNPETENDPCQK